MSLGHNIHIDAADLQRLYIHDVVADVLAAINEEEDTTFPLGGGSTVVVEFDGHGPNGKADMGEIVDVYVKR